MKSIPRISFSLVVVAAGSQIHAQTMYAVDSSRALSTIDIATGAKTPTGLSVSSNAGTTGGLTYDRASNVVYVTSTSLDSLFTLDLATGAATLVGAYGDPNYVMHGLEWDSSTNTLYGMSSHDAGLYTINTTTGFASLVGTTGLTSFSNLGYNSLTNTMYMTNSGSDSSYTIDRGTGGVTLLGPLATSTNPNGVAFNMDNGVLYMVDNSLDNFYSINMATGGASLIGSTGAGNLLGLAYINPVPEPSTILVVALGGLGLLVRRRKS